jgi:hypothetical protein
VSKSAKHFLLFLIGLILIGSAYVGYQGWKSAEETAVLSCLSSIAATTDRAMASGKIQSDGSSRELTKEEVSKFLIENPVGDCSRHEYVFEEVHIAIGEGVNRTSKSPLRVWTNGPDEQPGTSDDLMISWSENAR